MKLELSIPGLKGPVIEFGYTVNCPEKSVLKIWEDPKWFAIQRCIPKEQNTQPVVTDIDKKTKGKTKRKTKETPFFNEKDTKVASLKNKVFINSHEVKAPTFNKIVECNLSQPLESDIGEFQLIEKEIVPLNFSFFSDISEDQLQEVQEQEVQEQEVQEQEVQEQEVEEEKEPVSSDREITVMEVKNPPKLKSNNKKKKTKGKKATQPKQKNQAEKTNKVVGENLPKDTGNKSKKTAEVAKKIIPVVDPKKPLELVQIEPKEILIPKKETHEDLLEKISADPAYFLKIKEDASPKDQYSLFAKTALVSLILDHPTLVATKNGDKIKEKAQKILPQVPSILKNPDEMSMCNDLPTAENLFKNDHQYVLNFFTQYLDVSYEQILTLLEQLQIDFTQPKDKQTGALFAAMALIPIPAIARKIATGKFGEIIKEYSNFYCMAYHRKDPLIFKEGAELFPHIMLLADDTIKNSTDKELEKCWLNAGIEINVDGKFVFEDVRFPARHRETICNSFELLLKGIRNNPSIVLHVGLNIKNFPLLLKNALARIWFNQEVQKSFGHHKKTLLGLAKISLPKSDSKITGQEMLNKLLQDKPEIIDLFQKGTEMEILTPFKNDFFNCSYDQFIRALISLNLLLSKPLPIDTNLLKDFSFFSLIDVEEAMYGVLSNMKWDIKDSSNQQNIVRMYPKNLRLVLRAIEGDPNKRAIYFADDSIRYNPKYKKELTKIVSILLVARGTKAVDATYFPKKILDDPEIVSPLMDIEPDIFTFATEKAQKELKEKYDSLKKEADLAKNTMSKITHELVKLNIEDNN